MIDVKKWAAFAMNEKEINGTKKTFWTRIGAAFQNRDGSFTVKLDAFPRGDMQIREDTPRDARTPDNAAETPF